MKAFLFALAVLCVAEAELVEYALSHGDTVSGIVRTCGLESMWKIQGQGRKFTNPYTAERGTIIRVLRECRECLAQKPPSAPEGWQIYRTDATGSETLDNIALTLGVDASQFVLSDLTTKPTDLKCVMLYYPYVAEELKTHDFRTVQEAATLEELAVNILDESATWDELKADAEGNPIADASAATVMQPGAKVFFRVWDHDAVMSKATHEEHFGNKNLFHTKGAAVSRNRRWPARRPIPYGVSSAVPSFERNAIREAVADIQRRTCVRFTSAPSSRARGRIRFEKYDRGCSAHVGVNSNGNIVWSGGSCGKNTQIHELGHAVGLWHEQARSDRDRHIEMRWNNIPSSWRSEYEKKNTINTVTPYDYASIMHYPPRDRMRARPNRADTAKITGERGGLSRWDIHAFNWLLGYNQRCGSRDHDGIEVIPSTCDESLMPDLKKQCGSPCRVLTGSAERFRSCKNFCANAGLTCVGSAQDGPNDSCTSGSTDDCDVDHFVKYSGTSDMICECRPKTAKDATCKDSTTFRDVYEETCSDWFGYDCLTYAGSPYTSEERGDIIRNCPVACGICSVSSSSAESSLEKYEGTCGSMERWPDVATQCMGCTVLVNNFESYGTCGEYCRSVGKVCKSAAEDLAGTCEPMMDLECEEEWEVENSQALCECVNGSLNVTTTTTTEPSSALVALPALSLMALVSALLC